MTKTTLILPEQAEPKIEFPVLARFTHGSIYQFRNEHEARALIDHHGTQVLDGESAWKSLSYPVTDKKAWTILPKGTKIVIEQL